jgi:PEP-CTERM motif
MTKRFSTFCVLAVTFIYCGSSTHADSITYDFIEKGTTTVGATMEFASPPASATASWTAPDDSALLSLQITDPAIATVGVYPSVNFMLEVASDDGSALDEGTIAAFSLTTSLYLFIGASPGSDSIESFLISAGSQIETFGDWKVATSAVPEPSSLMMAGTATAVGLGALARRRNRR